ncbi:MAG TPA: PocR ligand-binding domain-containing protein, partial [Candidatus Sumerlaeota bacterium]|nr:PocR ligand-binding domain-containing protein [Candidatus Sumerlaeota bacterium]
LQKPPWWTPRYAIVFGCGLVVLILLALGWATLLQRKVREHTEQIRLRIEAETAVGRRFSLVWENSVDGMRLTNADGEIIQVNKAYCELVQKSREELEGHNLEVVYPEPDRERLLTMYQDEFPRRAIPPRREGKMTLWNGKTFWFEQTNTFFEQPGQPLLLFSQLRDITERKRAEEVVRTQIVALTRPLDDPAGIQFGDLFNIEEIQRIQDSFANATGVASIITQPDGTPITRPSNFCRLCRDVIRKTEIGLANCYKSDATLGGSHATGPIIRPCLSGGLWDAGASINVGGKHIANWLIGQARDPGQDDEQMVQYADVIGADREEFRSALAEVPVMSRQQFSQVANMLFSFAGELSLKAYQNVQQARFITERNHAEEEKEHLQAQLLQAQKMEAVGQLAGGVAHDFNNLLAVILGYGELIETGLPENSPWREEVLQIISAALRAKDLTRQLLAFSRKQVLEMKPVDLNLLVENMEKMMRRLLGETIELLVILAPNLGRVKADTTQLQQVMLNLCVNARDAMPGGGVLTIETQAVPFAGEESVRPATLQACPYVLLSISDTGHGMDAETQRRIFDPFFTTKEVGKGTGLGLATAYGIVKQHGGEILVESVPGHGSVFKVFLPEAQVDREEVKGSSEEGTSEGQGEVILVVEDEQVVRELTCRMLTSLGYRVIEAPEPELCGEIARSSDRIDLLLTDVIMPGLNGRQVYEQIKGIRPDLKVIFMSGYTDDVIADQGILEEGVHLINKPFKAADLNKVVREVLRT